MISRNGVPIDGTGVLIAVAVGALALAVGTFVATRKGAPDARTPRGTALAPLVPWLGTVLTLVLLVRGATPAAVVVAIATAIHAGLTRLRAARSRSRRRR